MRDSAAIYDMEAVTPFGVGIEPLWENLSAGKTAIGLCTRFSVDSFSCKKCSALVLNPSDQSLVWDLVNPIREKIRSWDADFLILATTKGEIDLLEKQCRNEISPSDCTLSAFLRKTLKYLNISKGLLVSSACASSTTGIAYAAGMIRNHRAERVAVLGIDIVSLFIFSGFSALQALSSDNSGTFPAKPFDKQRDGLILGEACAAVLLARDGLPGEKSLGRIAGWGTASDANHVTGPSRDGSGLAAAVSAALKTSHIIPENIGAVSAHGTGTIYNDNMEMMAFRTVFPEPVPVFSVKGALGHCMGASGVLETVISLKALRESRVPPTAGFSIPDENSEGWVSNSSIKLRKEFILKTSSGFGGVNAALILGKS